MLCPKCKNEASKVTNSRKRGNHIWRRRQCLICDYRWSTFEIPAERFDEVMEELKSFGIGLMNKLGGTDDQRSE